MPGAARAALGVESQRQGRAVAPAIFPQRTAATRLYTIVHTTKVPTARGTGLTSVRTRCAHAYPSLRDQTELHDVCRGSAQLGATPHQSEEQRLHPAAIRVEMACIASSRARSLQLRAWSRGVVHAAIEGVHSHCRLCRRFLDLVGIAGYSPRRTCGNMLIGNEVFRTLGGGLGRPIVFASEPFEVL